MEQHPTFDILAPKSYVEYKKNSFYFYSHIDDVKPLILNKQAIKELLAAFVDLAPYVSKEQKVIQQDSKKNAKLLDAGKEPFEPQDKLVYTRTIAAFKCWEIRQQVSKYKNNLYVWTKLFVQDKEDKTVFYPCKGGILWPEENYQEFFKFVNDCLNNKI